MYLFFLIQFFFLFFSRGTFGSCTYFFGFGHEKKKKLTPKHFFLPVHGTIFSPPFFRFFYIYFLTFFFLDFRIFDFLLRHHFFFSMAVCKKPKLFALLVPRGTELFAKKFWAQKFGFFFYTQKSGKTEVFAFSDQGDLNFLAKWCRGELNF